MLPGYLLKTFALLLLNTTETIKPLGETATWKHIVPLITNNFAKRKHPEENLPIRKSQITMKQLQATLISH